MSLTDKQGRLGDLDTKSWEELEDLLQRQKHLLNDKSLIKRLPDNGQKILSLVTKIKTALAQKAGSTAGRPTIDIDEQLKQFAELRLSEKVVTDERGGQTFQNSYERVIKNVNRKEGKPAFKLNRTYAIRQAPEPPGHLRLLQSTITSIQEDETHTFSPISLKPPLPQPADPQQHQDSETFTITELGGYRDPKDLESSVKSRLQHRYDANLESAVHHSKYQYNSAKEISIEDSIRLIVQQRRQYEEAQAQQAAERLGANLHVTFKLQEFCTSDPLIYRTSKATNIEESDEDVTSQSDSDA